MSKAERIVGRMTHEESVEVLTEIIAALPEEKLYDALMNALSPQQIEELAAISERDAS